MIVCKAPLLLALWRNNTKKSIKIILTTDVIDETRLWCTDETSKRGKSRHTFKKIYTFKKT